MPPPPKHLPDCAAFCYDIEKLVIPEALAKNPDMIVDRVQVAMEMGRLDLVAISLALLGAAAALFAFFGFLEIRYRAKAVARDTAEQIARKVVLAELDKRLASLVDDAVSFHIQAQDVGSAAANEIAESAGNGETPSETTEPKP